MSDTPAPPAAGPWTPLRRPVFRALFIATAVSNLGGWMQEVGRAWLMTELAPSPLLVALVQSATMAAMALFSLPAGVVADAADRRLVLLIAQGWMMMVAALLGLLTVTGTITPALVLLLSFLAAAGATFAGPAFQAALPDLVKDDELPAAVTLNGLSFNASRAIGPAIGGAVVAVGGAAGVFFLNAASFAAVLLVLLRWRGPPAGPHAREPFAPALRAGLRFARNAGPLRRVLALAIAFALPASAFWALLPVVASAGVDATAAGYGFLLGLVGTAAVVAGLLTPRLRAGLGDRWLGTIAFIALALGIALTVADDAGRIVGMLVAGFGWPVSLTLLMIAAQRALPGWVRGRGLSMFLLCFALAMAIGSAAWGVVAERLGASTALMIAAGTQAASALVYAVWPPEHADDQTSVERAWPAPRLAGEPHPDAGPVLITIEYRVPQENTVAFAALMARIGRARRAEGSIEWRLFEHAGEPGRWIEQNLVPTWREHLAQRTRGTAADAEQERQLAALLKAGCPPRVDHWFAGRAKPIRVQGVTMAVAGDVYG